MADSIKVPVNARLWTEIAVGKEKGFITNWGNDNVILREAASGGTLSASDTFGHTLGVADDDGYSYDVSSGQSIYARASSKTSEVIITPVG